MESFGIFEKKKTDIFIITNSILHRYFACMNVMYMYVMQMYMMYVMQNIFFYSFRILDILLTIGKNIIQYWSVML